MQRYEQARDDLVARLHELEDRLSEDRNTSLHAARTRLARGKFVLAVVGEFSSGKSFLLNALLGKFGLLATDINPSTATITELEHGEIDEATAFYEDGRSERVPIDSLGKFVTTNPSTGSGQAADAPVRVLVKAASPFLQRGFIVADTPGLASINPAHRRATLQFLPGADAVLYLIDTQQPFSEGDASFLGIIRQHIDTIFIVQTKIDLWGEPQADGRSAWEQAYERIARLAALHAPGTYVYAISARDYVDGTVAGDAGTIERSRFPAFLNALDASLIKRTGRARLQRAGDAATAAASDETETIDRDLAMLELGAPLLTLRREAIVPQLQRAGAEARAFREELLSRGARERQAAIERGRALAEELERALAQAFDITDVAKLRDRERLHLIVDRVVAQVTGEFADRTAGAVTGDASETLARAREHLPLRWSLADAGARAFGAQGGTSLWSGDVANAIAATIVLEAIGGPAIALVQNVAARFASRPPGGYMKRELAADLRSEIFPRLTAEVEDFVGRVGARLGRIYDDLAAAIGKAVLQKRDADLGSIERALRAHESGDVATTVSVLRDRRAELAAAIARCDGVLASFMAHEEEIAPADPGPQTLRAAHAEPSFDRASYDRGLRPERWRVAVLGGLRRGKSSLINAFANRRVLTDERAGSVRFPIHVRYGERELAYCLDAGATWREIPFEEATAAAAETAVLLLVPWSLPKQLVLVHAPAFDSGDPDADDVNVAVASHASEVLCLFSRQLSDRELDLYDRVAEFGRPMLFAHTIADNESPKERRRVVELAAEYLKTRGIPSERVFTVSANDYVEALEQKRAASPWNETEALRSTLESHAEAHMARLERLERARATAPAVAENVFTEPPVRSKEPGLLARVFGKGRRDGS
jgi:tRNA U34 5-carboxymethylaminomethyl modifying GTPase MnmE/TrmE